MNSHLVDECNIVDSTAEYVGAIALMVDVNLREMFMTFSYFRHRSPEFGVGKQLCWHIFPQRTSPTFEKLNILSVMSVVHFSQLERDILVDTWKRIVQANITVGDRILTLVFR